MRLPEERNRNSEDRTTSDAELLCRYVENESEPAFAELVSRYLDLVYSAALRQVHGDAHRAKDVTQVVFTALARKAPALTLHPVLAGWLYTATQHAAAKAIRKEMRRHAREQEAHLMHEILAPRDAAIDWDRVRPVLDDAMRELDRPDREAVLLRYFARRPFAEIGAALHLSEDAARMRVERALDKLHGLLGRRGVTSTTAALSLALGNQAVVSAPAGFAATVASHAVAAAGNTLNATAIFMSTPILVVGAIAIAAIAGAVYQSNQARQAETAATMAAQDRSALQIQLRGAEARAVEAVKQLAQAEQKAAGLQRELLAARTAPVGAFALPKTGRDSGGVVTMGFKSLDGKTQDSLSFIDSPEGRRAMMYEVVDKTHAALFRKLGWTAAQREQFKALMADQKEAGHQMFQAANAQGTKPGQELARSIAATTGADLQEKLRTAFGDATADAIRYFEATRPLRHWADELAKALFYTDTPLGNTQAEQLIDLMAANARNPEGRIDIRALNMESAIAQSQAVLSPPQVAALRQLETERQKQQALEEKFLAERNTLLPSKPPGN